MEEDQATSPLQNPTVIFGMAITGALLGLLAFVVSISANSGASELEKKIKNLEASVAEMASSAGQSAQFKKKIENIDKASDSLSLKVGEIDRNLRTLAEQTQAAINSVNSDIAGTRKMIQSGGSRSSSTASRGPRKKSPAPSAAAPKDGQYKIEKGDTLAKVARKFGFNTNALLDANPDVDPRKLKIGQIINLPK